MRTWYLAGLLKIELPAWTVRLTDGGVLLWGAEVFRGRDAVFGSVTGVESLAEGVGDEVPALSVTLSPAADADPADLIQPGFQTARTRFWIAEWDWASGAVTGTPDLMFDGQLDQVEFALSDEAQELACSVVSSAERLFTRNRGNGLSATFHKSVWPGETGHDQATGLTVPRAWGVEAPRGAAAMAPYANLTGMNKWAFEAGAL